MGGVVLGIRACSFLISGVALFRAIFCRWELCSLIQVDRRYNDDPAWRRAADSALSRFREAEFALRYGVVPAHPRWISKWPMMFLGGIASGFLGLGLYESVWGRSAR